jgi:hypothetical protein
MKVSFGSVSILIEMRNYACNQISVEVVPAPGRWQAAFFQG